MFLLTCPVVARRKRPARCTFIMNAGTHDMEGSMLVLFLLGAPCMPYLNQIGLGLTLEREQHERPLHDKSNVLSCSEGTVPSPKRGRRQ